MIFDRQQQRLLREGKEYTFEEKMCIRDSYAGALSHLKTDFQFSLKDNKGLGDLLKVLHPTPAVCGLPKEEAYRFILQNEGYDRRYYSGFIGWLDPEGRTDIYVNLRCMHIEDEQLTLYAGGGLLALSLIHI